MKIQIIKSIRNYCIIIAVWVWVGFIVLAIHMEAYLETLTIEELKQPTTFTQTTKELMLWPYTLYRWKECIKKSENSEGLTLFL